MVWLNSIVGPAWVHCCCNDKNKKYIGYKIIPEEKIFYDIRFTEIQLEWEVCDSACLRRECKQGSVKRRYSHSLHLSTLIYSCSDFESKIQHLNDLCIIQSFCYYKSVLDCIPMELIFTVFYNIYIYILTEYIYIFKY